MLLRKKAHANGPNGLNGVQSIGGWQQNFLSPFCLWMAGLSRPFADGRVPVAAAGARFCVHPTFCCPKHSFRYCQLCLASQSSGWPRLLTVLTSSPWPGFPFAPIFVQFWVTDWLTVNVHLCDFGILWRSRSKRTNTKVKLPKWGVEKNSFLSREHFWMIKIGICIFLSANSKWL